MHALANPARFLRIARPATTWLLLTGLVLAVGGMAAGLTLTPPDYLQGETVRILYIHVPSAWLGMAGWLGIAAASLLPVRGARLLRQAQPSRLFASSPVRFGAGQPGEPGGNGTGG